MHAHANADAIRRNEAAIEICMHDVTDFRRPYTVLESTTAESKTSLFFLFCTWELFSGHRNIDLTPPRIHFTTSCQIITQIRGSHGDTKFEAMQSIDFENGENTNICTFLSLFSGII